jgi:formylglycine-generating enzyme required for sulfatase activity
MRNLFLPALVLASAFQSTFAQGLLQQTFGSGANAFTMDFVTIGNPNNAPDATGYGSVAYTYNLGKYEVSRDMIQKANAFGGLGITMYDSVRNGGDGPNRPASSISWYEAATFVNWLNISSGGVVAYKFDSNGNFQLWSPNDVGYNPNNLYRNSLANFFLPSSSEWHKGAYGSPDGTWYRYPNGSNSSPALVPNGTTGAVYGGESLWYSGGQPSSADITNAGGLSPFGTMAQGGNVWEWTESAADMTNNVPDEYRLLRGGSWDDVSPTTEMSASYAAAKPPTEEWNNSSGFRVAASAAIPEPSSLSLLALGGMLLALRRRK